MTQPEWSSAQIGYHKFQEPLFDRRLRPGHFVSQRELGAMLGLSVGALREILLRLQSEGLLLVQPKRGIQNPVIDLPMIRDAFQIRMTLEREAVMHAVRNISNDVLAAQKKAHLDVLAELECVEGHEVPDNGQNVDAGLYHLLIEGTENALLQQAYGINAIRIRLIQFDRISLTCATLPDAFADHLAVIDAILIRDVHSAVDAIDRHMMNVCGRAMEL